VGHRGGGGQLVSGQDQAAGTRAVPPHERPAHHSVAISVLPDGAIEPGSVVPVPLVAHLAEAAVTPVFACAAWLLSRRPSCGGVVPFDRIAAQ
jgi:hypothetical protein